LEVPFSLAKVSSVLLRDEPWSAGNQHTQRQRCIQVVEVDVSPASPYKPKRRLHP
jgi:hypothetical protein